MPKLQTFNAGAVRAPRSGVRADAGDFGGSVGEVLSQAGVGIGRFAAAEQIKADKAAAKAAKLEEERQTDIARDYISSSRNSLNLAAQQFAIDNPDATAEEKAKYFDSQAEQFADGAPNDIAKASIGRNIDDVRFGVLTDANKVDAVRNLDRRRDSLNTAIATNANIVQNDPSKLDIRMNEVLGHIDNSMLLTENAKRDKRLEAQQVLVNASLNGRLVRGDNFDPEGVIAEVKSGKFDGLLKNPKAVIASAEAAIKGREVDARLRMADIERKLANARLNQANDFLTRLTAEETDNPVTVDEVLKSELVPFGKTGPTKEKIINLLEDKSLGKDVNKLNYRLYNVLFRKIIRGEPLTSADEGPITPDQLIGFVGKGLPDKQYKALVAEIDGIAKGTKTFNESEKAFRRAVSSIIAPKNTLGISDPKAEELLFNFWQQYLKKRDGFISDGKDPSVLLDPESKEYFGASAKQFRRSQSEILNSLANNIRRADSITSGTDATPDEVSQIEDFYAENNIPLTEANFKASLKQLRGK